MKLGELGFDWHCPVAGRKMQLALGSHRASVSETIFRSWILFNCIVYYRSFVLEMFFIEIGSFTVQKKLFKNISLASCLTAGREKGPGI